MTDDAKTEAHTHCWHKKGNSMFTSYPPQWDEVCCHCGAVQRVPPKPPPGHGPHHPLASQPFTVTW